MPKGIAITLGVIILALLGIYLFANVPQNGAADTAVEEKVESGGALVEQESNGTVVGGKLGGAPDAVAADDLTVRVTDAGFVPRTLTVKVGDTVTFVNDRSQKVWPASNVHPTHRLYPTEGGCIGSIFDACRGLERGESYSFTFDVAGIWGYHDHLAPSQTGVIVVE